MRKLYTEENIELIANAIRDKLDITDKMKVKEMPDLILRIPNDGEKGAGGKNYVYVSDTKELVAPTMPYDIDTVWLFSDTFFSPNIKVSDLETKGVTAVEYVNRNMIKLTLDTSVIKKGEEFTLRVLTPGYLHHNGGSIMLHLLISNTLDLLENTFIGRQVLTDSYSDQGTFTVNCPKYGVIRFDPTISTLTKERQTLSSITVDGNCAIKAGNSKIDVNNRDNGYQQIDLLEAPLDEEISLTRVTWQGYMPYQQNNNNRAVWDIYFLGNGDMYVRIASLGTNASGVYRFRGTNYTNPGAGGYVSFYRQNYYGTKFIIRNERYSIDHHNKDSESPILETTLEKVLEETLHLELALDSAGWVDGGSWALSSENFSWKLGENEVSSFTVNADSIISFSGGSLYYNQQDASVNTISHGVYKLTDLGMLCYKIRWDGRAHYDNLNHQIYELYLFENGDAMVKEVQRGDDTSGNYSFCGNKFTIEENGTVCFYQDSEGRFTVAAGPYDISKHT